MPNKVEVKERFEITAIEQGVAPSDWALPASTTTGDGGTDTSSGDGSWCCCCCCCWDGNVSIF